MRRVAALILALIVSGCTSSFVGRWRTANLPPAKVPDQATSLTVVIKKDHTFAAFFENRLGATVAGYNGTWKPTAKSQILMQTVNGPEGTAQLLDDTTLLASGEGVPFKLKRSD